MKRIGIYIFTCFWVILARAQDITIAGYEYWFDNHIDNKISSQATSGTITLEVDVSALNEGIHYLNFRAKDNRKVNLWSSPVSYYFFRTRKADHSKNQLTKYEYWLDDKFAERKQQEYTVDKNGMLSTDIDVSKLRTGMHYLNLRIQDSFNKWSNPVSHYFFRTGADYSKNLVTKGEYWLDNQSTNRTAITSNGEGIFLLNDLDVAKLGVGMHYFSFRAQDSYGKWTTPVTYYFFRPGADHSKNSITKCEYWLDNQSDKRIEMKPDDKGVVALGEVDVSKLGAGMHYFNFRTQDSFGLWSSPVTYYFFRTSADRSQNSAKNYEYWLDNYFDKRTKGVMGKDGVLTLNEVDVSALEEGYHYFNFRVQDSFGAWSNPISYYFYRLAHVAPLKNLITQYRYHFNNEKSTEKLVKLNPPVNPLEWKDAMIEVPNVTLTQIPDSFGMTNNKTATQVEVTLPVEVQFVIQFNDSTNHWSNPTVHHFKHIIKKKNTLTAISLNKKCTEKKPSNGTLLSYRIDVTKGDSIYWKADQPCAIALFNSTGEWVGKLSANELLNGQTMKTPQKGTYYAFLHSAVTNATYDQEEISFICIGENLSDTIHVEVPGTLPEMVADPEVLNKLTLTGYLNGTDIKFIRSLPNLAMLDIDGAHIVEGGKAYYKDYRTANEVTGDYMFNNLTQLTRLILSKTTTKLGASALERCSGLIELTLPASITKVGDRAINGCTRLLTINWNCNVSVAASAFSAPDQMGNCLVYAPAGTEVSYEGNVVIGGIADRITLTHAKGFRCPTAFKAKDITYTRSFSMASGKGESAGWETLALPFTVQKFSHAKKGELAPFNSGIEGTKPFWLRKLNPTNGYEDVTTLEANTPYILSMPNSSSYEDEFNISGVVTFHAEHTDGVEVKATVPASLIRMEGPNFTTVPSFETTLQHDTVYAINLTAYEGMKPGGAFVKNLRNVNPFETYAITKASPAHAPKLYSIGGNGGNITGLDDALLKKDESLKIYTIRDVLYIESDQARTIHIYGTDGNTVRIVDVDEGKNEVIKLDTGVYLLEGKKIVIKR